MHIEKTVFLSYRRTDIAWALALFHQLTHHGFDVFFDFTGLASGDFETIIVDNIRSRAHFLVLLTPTALARCSNFDDWLRREIEEAIAWRRNIVPIMLDGFSFSRREVADCLTGDLALLRRYNALSVPPDYFEEAMGRLRDKFLNVPLSRVEHPASETARKAAQAQQSAAAAAAGFSAGPRSSDFPGSTREQEEHLDLHFLALPDLEPVTMSEVGTKLDLARAYMDMGDPNGAINVLEEVVSEGTVARRQEALRLIAQLRLDEPPRSRPNDDPSRPRRRRK